MGRPRKYDDKAEGYAAQNARRKRERLAAGRQFIGVDGEGIGRDPHRYVLLGVGDAQISDTGGLDFHTIMDFLWGEYLGNPAAVFAGFFLGYDFTQWFKTLPEERARMLLTSEGKAKRARKTHQHLGPFPVEYKGWEFDILGNKRFKLRKSDTGDTGWLYINDAGPFFQTSLLAAIDPAKWDRPIVSADEYAAVEAGKAKRDSAVLDTDMRRYNSLENDILARLLSRLETGLRTAGVKLNRTQWFGPGQAAQKWMGGVKVPTRGDVEAAVPEWALKAAAGTYFGGWFEIFAHGHVGDAWEYDINSAYPFIASRLPCLIHGDWREHTSREMRSLEPGQLGLLHAHVRGDGRYIGAMLHRLPDGNIIRPRETSGWFWSDELNAAMDAGLIDSISVHRQITYTPCDCRPPMRGLAGLYDKRLEVGKDSPEGKAYKLVYNSVYGKLAQTIGEPKFGNKIYASLITSGCRTMILNAIATHPGGENDVLMVATDGIYMRNPHPNLPTGDGLGLWSVARKKNLTLFKPGVYWDDSTREAIARKEKPSFKARGVNAAEFGKSLDEIDMAFRAWRPGGRPDFPAVTFTSQFGMVTALQALRRNSWDTAGLVYSPTATQDSDPAVKRRGIHHDAAANLWRSTPHLRGPMIESKPYDGKPEDWVDPEAYGVTPDGNVWDSWVDMLKE